MAHTRKTFHAIHINLKKMKKPPDEYCTRIFFALSTILIFGVTYLHRLYRILKGDIRFIRVPKMTLKEKKSEPGDRFKIQVNPVGRQEISLPKDTPKNTLFIMHNLKGLHMKNTLFNNGILRTSFI